MVSFKTPTLEREAHTHPHEEEAAVVMRQ